MTSQSQVKLRCRNVWMVYGSNPGRYFQSDDHRNATDSFIGKLRDEGFIPAAIDVNFDLLSGEIFAIMGLSGSGKSTVVRCLSRLVEPTFGEVILDGENLLEASDRELIEIRRHKMGMVFQNFGLLPHLTVFENIAFPLSLQKIQDSELRVQVERVIELVGLEGRESSFPRQLSGGQQQRVGIARSLAVEPEIWFLDEPFSALDPLIRKQMQDEFLRIQQLLHKSIVFITHDFLEALRVADRMAIMRDGRIVQIGTPQELVFAPADDYVAQFTSEVPRIRVLTAGQIVEPIMDAIVDDTRAMPVAPMDLPVEDLLPQLARHPSGVLVKGADGDVLGIVTPDGVIRSLSGVNRASASPISLPDPV
ncbi:MAG: ATP-binding cassette domain-containing protein [Paracoccaceae bacterium]|nr:ATP-binding cassette domain-containing protein [Paracoccaceae bacterium]